MTPLAWSPLGGGRFGDRGKVDPKHPKRKGLAALLKVLDETARKYDATRTVVTLAWLLKHPSGIIPIVGSADPAHIRAAAKADGLDMDREDWYRILVAARMEPLP
jgi:predicted oxidoreductase